MSMAHLSDVDFVAYVERNAKGQPPWQFIPPDDVLRLVALWKTAQARVAELEKEQHPLMVLEQLPDGTSRVRLANEDEKP